MVRSRGLSYLLGVLTCWPVVYLGIFLGFILVLVSAGGPGPGRVATPDGVLAIFVLHLFTMLLMLGLLVFYLVAPLRDERLRNEPDRRTLWVVLNIVVGPFAWPVFWWVFLRPGSQEFRIRAGTA